MRSYFTENVEIHVKYNKRKEDDKLWVAKFFFISTVCACSGCSVEHSSGEEYLSAGNVFWSCKNWHAGGLKVSFSTVSASIHPNGSMRTQEPTTLQLITFGCHQSGCGICTCRPMCVCEHVRVCMCLCVCMCWLALTYGQILMQLFFLRGKNWRDKVERVKTYRSALKKLIKKKNRESCSCFLHGYDLSKLSKHIPQTLHKKIHIPLPQGRMPELALVQHDRGDRHLSVWITQWTIEDGWHAVSANACMEKSNDSTKIMLLHNKFENRSGDQCEITGKP